MIEKVVARELFFSSLEGRVPYWLLGKEVDGPPKVGTLGKLIMLTPRICPNRTVIKKAKAKIARPIKALTIVPRAFPIASLSPPEVIHLKAPITRKINT